MQPQLSFIFMFCALFIFWASITYVAFRCICIVDIEFFKLVIHLSCNSRFISNFFYLFFNSIPTFFPSIFNILDIPNNLVILILLPFNLIKSILNITEYLITLFHNSINIVTFPNFIKFLQLFITQSIPMIYIVNKIISGFNFNTITKICA